MFCDLRFPTRCAVGRQAFLLFWLFNGRKVKKTQLYSLSVFVLATAHNTIGIADGNTHSHLIRRCGQNRAVVARAHPAITGATKCEGIRRWNTDAAIMAIGRSVADVVGRRQVGGTPFAQLGSAAAALDRALRQIFMLADAAPVGVRRIGVGTVVARAAPSGCVKLARHTAAALCYAVEHKRRTRLGCNAIRARRDIGWAGASRAVAVLRRVTG